ncbi:MAG: efflux RND transporter permease subunit [SAR324 cluster bacterium]|nr:efflux RND transporter permease subunit [SAR324 cluster bacterium]
MEFKPSKLAIYRPSTMYILMLLVIFSGASAYLSLPRESEPDIQIPFIIVTVPFPGAAPADVESQITNKLEKEFQNIDHLKEMKSTSTDGASVVTLEFKPEFNIDDAMDEVREKLDTVEPELPDDAEDAVLREINLSEEPILIINLSGDIGLVNLKTIAEDLKDRIESIPGILEVERIGGLEKEVQVNVDPNKLRYYNLDLNMVSDTIASENRSIPGGTMNIGPMRFPISVPGEVRDVEEIQNMIITSPGNGSIAIKDIANVEFTFKELENRSRFNGLESISLEISKRTGENLTRISARIKEIVKEEEAKYEGKVRYSFLQDKAQFVDQLISDLENNIFTGILFVFIVLLLVIGGRNALIVGLAIPFSMLMSFMILQWVGITLNFIVLFSLILALGMMVDNAIVIVENIYRHVQSGKPRREAAVIGVSEVAFPVISSTVTTLVAFFPLIFMPGIIGEFMNYLPKTLIITLSCSLFVGLIFNPVICATLMKRPKIQETLDEVALVEKSKLLVRYRMVLEWALRHPWISLLGMACFWWGVVIFYFAVSNPEKKTEFFPVQEPRDASVIVSAPFGTNLETSNNIVKEIEKDIFPYRSYTDGIIANVGDSNRPWDSRIRIAFPDWRGWTEMRPSDVIEEVRKILPKYVGAEIRLKPQESGPPTGRAVNIELTGEDYDLMNQAAKEIEKRIIDVQGLVNLEIDYDTNRSELRVLIDRDKIARHGLRMNQVASLIRAAFNGRDVSTYHVNQDEYDIIVRLDKKFRQYDTDLESLFIMTPSRDSIPLSELASVSREPATGSLRHIEQKRVVTIAGDASKGRSGADILKESKSRIEDFQLPNGVSISYTGANQDQEESQAFLTQSFVVAIFLIFMVLVTQFNSIVLPFVILTSVFASLSGVFLGMIIHGLPISVLMGGIGTISLAGIVVNNAIVLIDYTNQLRARGFSRHEAIVLAGMVRLRPVMLTAVTTLLGLLPITMGMDINFYRWPDVVVFGSEGGTFWKPMNFAVIYGLTVATFLTLIMVPILYSLNDHAKVKLKKIFRKKRKPEIPAASPPTLNETS